MNVDEFSKLLEGYLDDYRGTTPLPADAREAIRAEVAATGQIGPIRRLLRYTPMTMTPALSTAVRYGLVATVAAAATLIGASLLGTNVGGPSNPTPIPTATPVSIETLPFGPLDPGEYGVASIEGLSIRFTVPEGWERPSAADFVGPGLPGGGLSFWTVGNLYGDPCVHDNIAQSLLVPRVGTSVDDLVTALGGAIEITVTEPARDTTIGGYPARTLALEPQCVYAPWRTDSNLVMPAGTDVRFWVLRIQRTRLVIVAHLYPEATATDRAELQTVIDSIRISPVPAAGS